MAPISSGNASLPQGSDAIPDLKFEIQELYIWQLKKKIAAMPNERPPVVSMQKGSCLA